MTFDVCSVRFSSEGSTCGVCGEKAELKKPKQNRKGNNVLLAETMKICSNFSFSCNRDRVFLIREKTIK